MTVCFDPENLAAWSGGEWVPCAPPGPLSAVIHDTKQMVAGALFVAIRGARFDGHDFIGKAVAGGAVAALVSRARAAGLAGHGLPLLVVDDPLAGLQKMATGYRQHLGLTVVGVTGSTGKTSVKEMIACLLEAAMPTARTKGNWNNEIGLPLSILSIPVGTKAGVLELGISHPGEMAPLCAIARPDWGVVTTVGPVHLEFFESVTSIACEKGELLRGLSADGTAVLSLDDPFFGVLRGMASCKVRTTSLRKGSGADYILVCNNGHAGPCEVEDRVSGGIHAFRLDLPGIHTRHNALMAIAVARGLGVSWPSIAEAFSRYVPPPMRWEQRTVKGVTVINDAYNANPISMMAALRTFKDLEVAGGKWLVLGDMLELGATEVEEHQSIGRALAGGPWAGLVTVGTLGAQIAEGALSAGMARESVHACGTTAAAADLLKERVAKGDALLVKASRGKRMEEIILKLAEEWGKD